MAAWILALPGVVASGCHSAPPLSIHKAIWVTRWAYRSPDDVRQIIASCASSGFDTVLLQVRGNATVFYPSRLEPWAEEFYHRSPGFDPLAVACREARRHGIQLHAWVNAVPGWRGTDLPPANQLYNRHPDWFLYDQDGARQALEPDYYVALNPCLPEVREHIARVCAEIAGRYPVAGIHLDYIRFLEPKKGHSFPRDARTLELYRRATGHRVGARKTDEAMPEDELRRWNAWKADQVTELVRTIRDRVHTANRNARITAAVMRTPERALSFVHQDWPRWLQLGLVDAVFPMQYDRDDDRFAERVGACRAAVPEKPIIMGIGAYLHTDPAQTVRQIALSLEQECQGYCLFRYASFFPTSADVPNLEPATLELRRKRRAMVLGGVAPDGARD